MRSSQKTRSCNFSNNKKCILTNAAITFVVIANTTECMPSQLAEETKHFELGDQRAFRKTKNRVVMYTIISLCCTAFQRTMVFVSVGK